MKVKVICFIAVLIFLLGAVGCKEAQKIPDGINITSENEIVVYERIRIEPSLKYLVDKESEILEVEILEIIPFSYEWFFEKYDFMEAIDATAYRVKVIRNYGDSDIAKSDEIMLYSRTSYKKYYEETVNLQKGKSYIIFLENLQDNAPKCLVDFVDYTIVDDEAGIIIPVSEDTYVVHKDIIKDLGYKEEVYNTGRNTVVEIDKYLDYDILPQNEFFFMKVTEKNLIEGIIEKRRLAKANTNE